LAHFLAGQGLFKKLSKRFHYGVTFLPRTDVRSGLRLNNGRPAIAAGRPVGTTKNDYCASALNQART
jgi:hypothetical protein